MDKKSRLVRTRLEAVEKGMGMLAKQASADVASHRRAYRERTGMADKLRVVARREPAAKMQAALDELAGALDELAVDRKRALLDRLNITVAARLKRCAATGIKPTRRVLDDRDATVKRFVKADDSLRTLRQKNAATSKTAKAERTREALKVRADHVNVIVEECAEKFEATRLEEMKGSLEEYVIAHMHYHARALERFTAVYRSLAAVDSREAVAEYHRELRRVAEDVDEEK
eukprot:PLAT13835.1.p1 GENE.PLAT13835.1~~PLAT13835.1.p1  ORF type:complete len:252 (+),score=86.53 PLAT13835.1:64-756(+)